MLNLLTPGLGGVRGLGWSWGGLRVDARGLIRVSGGEPEEGEQPQAGDCE